jgi:hypothetical protein
MAQALSQPLPQPAPIASADEAEQVAGHFVGVMEALVGIVQQETELVRAGRMSAAVKLEQPKADLTRLYISDTLRLRASHTHLSRIAPELLDKLRQSHDHFRALLQVNLTVLATAHAVSEGIVRGVSGALARQAEPQTYGASGRHTPPRHNASAPLAVSRSL